VELVDGRGWELEDLLRPGTSVARLSLTRNPDMGQRLVDVFAKYSRPTALQFLDISQNRVHSLEPLGRLTALEELHAADNSVRKIPQGFARLGALRVLQLAGNQIGKLAELEALRACGNLTRFNIERNPAADIAHARPYLVFHLPSVDLLDGEEVLECEREAARVRFEQGELGALRQRVAQQEQALAVVSAERAALAEAEAAQAQQLVQGKEQIEQLRAGSEGRAVKLTQVEEQLQHKTAELACCTAELAALDVQVAHYRIDTGFARADETPTKGGQMWPVATPPLSSDSLAAALQPSPVGSVGQGTMVGGQLSLTRSHDFDLEQSDLDQDGLDDWLGAQHARHATAKMAALGRDCAESLAARLTELNLEQLATLRVGSTPTTPSRSLAKACGIHDVPEFLHRSRRPLLGALRSEKRAIWDFALQASESSTSLDDEYRLAFAVIQVRGGTAVGAFR
jgi:hypothetical protein